MPDLEKMEGEGYRAMTRAHSAVSTRDRSPEAVARAFVRNRVCVVPNGKESIHACGVLLTARQIAKLIRVVRRECEKVAQSFCPKAPYDTPSIRASEHTVACIVQAIRALNRQPKRGCRGA